MSNRSGLPRLRMKSEISQPQFLVGFKSHALNLEPPHDDGVSTLQSVFTTFEENGPVGVFMFEARTFQPRSGCNKYKHEARASVFHSRPN